ncbi:MAG TPA: phage tail protein [Marmoricola sp.]|jgi:microcystin-dependent protein|nr:phage tail protein [Marmoricola sp.]
MAAANGFVPVGSVIAYAGCEDINTLNRHGWALCDGRSVDVGGYRDLFDAIGTANGSSDGDHFNLPDLQGYFLRCVDATGTLDTGPRRAARGNGNGGMEVGSLEVYSTAMASDRRFKAQLRFEGGSNASFEGDEWDMLASCGGTTQTFVCRGGDPESRPINAYVNFLIKTSGGDDPVPMGRLHPGMVVPYAGAEAKGQLAMSYAMCNGWAFPREGHEELYLALGPAHGTVGDDYRLPDYRGRFLRGVDNGSGHDPEVEGRSPMTDGGNGGNQVGSIQKSATGLPTQTPLVIHVPISNEKLRSNRAAGHDQAVWNPGTVDVVASAAGGELETRPVNANVDYYVLTTKEAEAPLFPIGGVIAFPGAGKAVPSPEGWLPCDGRSLPRTGAYLMLFEEIGATNGAVDHSHFNVPDYRGFFLRGCDHGTQRDPGAEGRIARLGGLAGDQVGSIQGWETARPHQPFTAAIHSPVVDHETAYAVGPLSGATADWMDPMQFLPVEGGDKETRPVNVNVQLYIRYA